MGPLFDERCVHCGQPAHEVLIRQTGRCVVLHKDTGLIYCNNLAGNIACLPSGWCG